MSLRSLSIILSLTLVGFLLRFWILTITDTHTSDGVAFLATAEYFKNPVGWEEIPARIRMPLYPFLVYIGTLITSADAFTVGTWINTIIGTLMIPVGFIIVRNLLNEKAGYLTALLFAVDFELIRFSVLDRADLLFSFLSLLIIYFFWRIPWERCNYKDAILFGLLLGIGQLSRSNAILYIPIYIVLWIIYIYI